MSYAKTVEITAQSTDSFDEAVRMGVKKASETLDQLRSVWVEDYTVDVEGDGSINGYRVRLKVTFELK